MDVEHVPIFCPIIIGKAAENLSKPVVETACKIPIEAEELCITAVIIVPANIPRTGFSKLANTLLNASSSERGLTESVRESIPVNKIPSPRQISPIDFMLSFLVIIIINIPIIAKNGARYVGVRNSMAVPSLKYVICELF